MQKFNVIIFGGPSVPESKTRNYGAHRIASHLREHGYTCLVVDFATALDWNTYKEIIKLTVDESTLMVGFSTTFMPQRITPLDGDEKTFKEVRASDGTITSSEKTIPDSNPLLVDALSHGNGGPWFDIIKETSPKTKIVFGGTAIASYMDYKQIDNFMYGHSETMIIDYLDSLSSKGNKRIFNRVLDYDYKAQNNSWDFRSSSTRYTQYDFITSKETLSLEVGRGCRFSCSFCSYPLIGQKNINDYIKFEDTLRAELLDNYNRWGTTQYFIVDDTFNDSTEKLLRVKKVLDSLPFKIKFWCYLRADLLASFPEQIYLLKDMGLSETFFGIETFYHATGKSLGKGMKPEKLKAGLAKCKEVWGNDVYIAAGFIVGLPYEPESSIIETCEYLRSPDCPIDAAWLHPLQMLDSNFDDYRMQWVYKSEYDKNYSKYGYYFDPPVQLEDFVLWRKKEDGSGIYSFEQAREIANRWSSTLSNKEYIGNFYTASLDHPILSNREATKKLSPEEYKKLIQSIDLSKLLLDTVRNEYFDPLLEKLRAEQLTY